MIAILIIRGGIKMIFGMELDKINALGATYTATEIRQQPKLWLETYNIVKDNEN